MTLYATLAYLRYKWIAKTRHGVHSPFVYSFVEQVLRNVANSTTEERLKKYLANYNLVWVNSMQDAAFKIAAAGVMDTIIIKGIHTDKRAETAWNELKGTASVQLSIDIFGYGLLFFNTAFKIPQHFVVQ